MDSSLEVLEPDELYWFIDKKEKTKTRENVYIITMVIKGEVVMPSPMAHLCAARQLAGPLGVRNMGSCYLGVIAPDGVHTRAGTRQEIADAKRHSHMGMRDLDSRTHDEYLAMCRSIMEWIARQETHPDRDYRLGYGVHVLTDVHWERNLYMSFKARHLNGEFGEEPKDQLYNRDNDWLEVHLYKVCDWRESVFEMLLAAEPADVDDLLAARDAIQWKWHVNDWFFQHTQTGSPVCFTPERVALFLEAAPSWLYMAGIEGEWDG